MDNVPTRENVNDYASSEQVSVQSLILRYNVYLRLITILVIIVGIGSGITYALPEDAVAQSTGICDRSAEVAEVIVAEIQNSRSEATCADITEEELGSIEGYLNVAPSKLQPGDFAGLTSLTSLDITGLDLLLLRSGTFAGLDSLETLNMRSPSVTTVHSGAFDGLPSITLLQLKSNSLKAVPRDVFRGLGSLTRLDFYANSVNALPLGIFSDLESLSVLDMHLGDVKDIPHGTFAGMPNLQGLHLIKGGEGALETGAFSGLDNLRWIVLDGAGITRIGSGAFAGLHNLRWLYLSDNKLATLPQGIFEPLINLEELHMDNNGLITLPSGSFDGLDELTHLYLHGNNFEYFPDGIFNGIESLEVLHLDRNQLVEISGDLVKGLTNLRELPLYNNQLTDVSDLDMSDLDSLEWIDFDGNELTTLPDDIFLAPPCSLRIIGLPPDPETGGMLGKTIDGVRYEILDSLPQASTPGCGEDDGIRDMWIDGIALSSGDIAKIRDGYTKLETISMIDSGLTSEQVIDLLANHASTTFDTIIIDSNDLSAWNTEDRDAMIDAFQKNENLIRIHISDTGINGETLMAILESTGISLERLIASGNDLSSWNDPDPDNQARLGEAFSRLPSSDWWLMDLSDTSIDSAAAGTILKNATRTSGDSSWVIVNLSDNQITEVDASWFEGWEALRRLDLSNNQITKLDPAVFAPLADFLVELHLDGNPFDPILSAAEFEVYLPSLEVLELPLPGDSTGLEMGGETEQLPETGGASISAPVAVFILGIGLFVIVAGGLLLSISSRRVVRARQP